MATNVQLITGWEIPIMRLRIKLFIIAQAFRVFRKPILAISEMKRLRDLHHSVDGSTIITKFVRSGNRSFWNSDYCGYPSKNLQRLIQNEYLINAKYQENGVSESPKLQTLIWGITNRCPLSCQHCYEWDNIAQSDHLDLQALKKILNTFKDNGLKHIQFSGGEPLARFHDLVELIREASPDMDCWVLTSGYGLTIEKADAMKKAGLTGVNISLDHWDEKLHNNFRNNDKSFAMALDAVKNCLSASIIVSLSLCATREFVTEDNLMKYASLAKEMGAQFIRILEPRAAGKYARLNVHLEKQQVTLLSDFTIKMNKDPRYKDFPIIAFYGYHQRKLGCPGGGNRYLYADPNGDVHACPFCRGKMGNLLNEPFINIIEKLKVIGCHEFKNQSAILLN